MSKLKIIIPLAVFAIIVVAGWRVASCYVANAQLQDDLQDLAAQVGTKIGLDRVKTDDDLRAAIIRKADSYDISLRPEQITVSHTGSGPLSATFLSVDYTARVNLVVYSVTLHFTASSRR